MNARHPALELRLLVSSAALLLLFIVLPLVSTLLGTTPEQFWLALTDPEVLRSIGLTFGAAAVATVLALLTGVPLAYLLARRRSAASGWWRRSSTCRS